MVADTDSGLVRRVTTAALIEADVSQMAHFLAGKGKQSQPIAAFGTCQTK